MINVLNCKCNYCEKLAHAYLIRGKDLTPVCKEHDADLIVRKINIKYDN